MGEQHKWHIVEDEEQAGRQLILSSENVNGFNSQREGHGNLWYVVFAVLIPIALVIILALLGRLVPSSDLNHIFASAPQPAQVGEQLFLPQKWLAKPQQTTTFGTAIFIQ